MPDIAPFSEDPILTAVAIAYRNPDYSLIADRVLPRKPVMSRSFKYQEYPLEANFTVPDSRIGRRSNPKMIEIEGAEQTAGVEAYGRGRNPLDDTGKPWEGGASPRPEGPHVALRRPRRERLAARTPWSRNNGQE